MLKTPHTPILVTGSHRSGTSWVGRMLSLPSEIGYIHEPFHPKDRSGTCVGTFSRWFEHIQGRDRGVRQCVQRALEFEYNPYPRLWTLGDGGHSVPRDLVGVGFNLVRAATNRWFVRRPLMKDPIALLSAEWLHKTFDMEVVVMVRHPAAFAGSLKKKGWSFPFEDLLSQTELMETSLKPYKAEIEAMCNKQSTIVEQAALLWSCLYHVVSRYRERHPSWQVVIYENLAGSPAPYYRRLYTRLDLQWTSRIASKIKRRTEANTESWKERLRKNEIQYIREETHDVWDQFYSRDSWG